MVRGLSHSTTDCVSSIHLSSFTELNAPHFSVPLWRLDCFSFFPSRPGSLLRSSWVYFHKWTMLRWYTSLPPSLFLSFPFSRSGSRSVYSQSEQGNNKTGTSSLYIMPCCVCMGDLLMLGVVRFYNSACVHCKSSLAIDIEALRSWQETVWALWSEAFKIITKRHMYLGFWTKRYVVSNIRMYMMELFQVG